VVFKPLADGVRNGIGSAGQVGRPDADLPPPRLLIIPDDVTDLDDFAPGDTRPLAPRPPRRDLGRATRTAAYLLAAALAGAGALYGFNTLVRPRLAGTRLQHPVTEAPPPPPLSSLVDTLSLAVGSFELRTRLFASHQMQCPDLQRGLVVLEERWAAYNAARRGNGSALDSSREATDRSLYSRVDDAESLFEHSACPRP
jgi:hypothetical protein